MGNIERKDTLKNLEDTLAESVQKKINEGKSLSEVERGFQAYENVCKRFGCVSEKDSELRESYNEYFLKTDRFRY